MGSAKLLLPWGGHTVIDQVLAAWRGSQVEQTVVVVGPESRELAAKCRECGVLVVEAEEQPVDMKASVRLGLAAIEARYAPAAGDAWLLAPADLPLLSATLVDQVIAAWQRGGPDRQNRIYVPEYRGRKGHPVLFPWSYAAKVFELPDEVGINSLTKAEPGPVCVATGERGAVADLDTPDDYERLRLG